MNESTEILLLRDINEDAQWLIRMVENLLSVTKIKDASASIIKTSELAEEVIAEAVQRVKSRFRSAEINVSVPAEALFVRMDATLIEQVLINLLENALKYSQPQTPVTLEVRKEPDWVKFSVIDQEKDSKRWDFSMNNNEKPTMDANRGMGIGLSICQSIIKAHNGLIGAYKADEKVVFYFQLPIDKGEKYEN
ncbi:Sensor protein KdpD [bioreactor metagenome]|uniref:Sensor protein KdpD n=1 Tax=bioreactor metagenome TaxID=1076179 RepID=A0A645AW10_9ZZZZ